MITANTYTYMIDTGAMTEDSVIIRKVLAGERDEFRHLATRHKDLVFAMIMRQTGDRELSMDLAQETFLKAYRNLSKFRFESEFSTWLIRIALNVTSSYYSSKEHKNRQKQVYYDSEMHSEKLQTNPHAQNELKQALRFALRELPEKLRNVVILCGLEGQSYDEAAKVLGIPVGTVRSRLNRARLMLRESFYSKDARNGQ